MSLGLGVHLLPNLIFPYRRGLAVAADGVPVDKMDNLHARSEREKERRSGQRVDGIVGEDGEAIAAASAGSGSLG